MRFLDQLEMLQRVDQLIRRKATGTPTDLASRLAVSRASVFRYINDLRDFGAPVEYCRFRESYYYSQDYTLSFDSILSRR